MPDPVAPPAGPSAGDPPPANPAAPPATPPAAPAAPPVAPAAPPAADPAAQAWADPKLPEGFEQNVELNQLLKSQGLNGKQAQAIVDFYLASEAQSAKEQETAAKELIQQFVAQLQAEAKADPEIGGAKWAETQALVEKALGAEKLIPKSAVEKLQRSNLIHDKDIQRMLRNVGKAISEGTSVGGTFGAPAPKQSIFDHPTSRQVHGTAPQR